MRQRLAELVALPTVVATPGRHRTRSGEIVTVTTITRGWANGHYADGTLESWDVSGRVLPSTLSKNDIITKEDLP